MSDNLALWNKVEKTDPKITKKVSIGGMSYTTIDAQHQIKNATEQWGSYGFKWGLKNITYDFSLMDTKGNTVAFVGAVFYYPNGEFELHSSILTVIGNKNPKFDDDFAKKIETDLLTKALSKLGFNADVFMGKFDDNKYVQQVALEKQAEENLKNPTKEQIEELEKLIQKTKSDKDKLLKFGEVEKLEDLTMSKYNEIKTLMLKKLAK